jgi:hypothetical protein
MQSIKALSGGSAIAMECIPDPLFSLITFCCETTSSHTRIGVKHRDLQTLPASLPDDYTIFTVKGIKNQ